MKLDPAEVFPAVHALALRGSLKRLPGDGRRLEAAGLVCSTPGGFILTDSGHRLHRALSQYERATLAGELDYAFDPAVESIATVWRELHEDYLQMLAYAQEPESI